MFALRVFVKGCFSILQGFQVEDPYLFTVEMLHAVAKVNILPHCKSVFNPFAFTSYHFFYLLNSLQYKVSHFLFHVPFKYMNLTASVRHS